MRSLSLLGDDRSGNLMTVPGKKENLKMLEKGYELSGNLVKEERSNISEIPRGKEDFKMLE
jgi:hypothetical protein